MKTKIKILEETLQKKCEEIDALRKKDNRIWIKRRQKLETCQMKAITMRANISYWEELNTGLNELPEDALQATEDEAGLLQSISQRLREQSLEADQRRSELSDRLVANPHRRQTFEQKTSVLSERLKGHAEDFEVIRGELGLDWLDFDALQNLLKDFRKETKPRVAFLRDTLE